MLNILGESIIFLLKELILLQIINEYKHCKKYLLFTKKFKITYFYNLYYK